MVMAPPAERRLDVLLQRLKAARDRADRVLTTCGQAATDAQADLPGQGRRLVRGIEGTRQRLLAHGAKRKAWGVTVIARARWLHAEALRLRVSPAMLMLRLQIVGLWLRLIIPRVLAAVAALFVIILIFRLLAAVRG